MQPLPTPAPPAPSTALLLADLRARISLLHRAPLHTAQNILPFGIPALDTHLPNGGLARAALHEIEGGGADATYAAAATGFAAGIFARLGAPVIWCTRHDDIYPPGLALAGLLPQRLLHMRVGSDAAILLVMEESLRHTGVGAVVGEIAQLSTTASRRLSLAAETSGVMAWVLRRPCYAGSWPTAAASGLNARTATTHWRITPHPSPVTDLGAHAVGRARWQVNLLRARNAAPATWILDACDATGCLALPALLANRSPAQTARNAA